MSAPMTLAFIVDSVPFTAAVISGAASLGGSESACLGLARALQARGHAVHVFTTKLADDAPAKDHAGVAWHRLEDLYAMCQYVEFDVVVALRAFAAFNGQKFPARMRLVWNQDLLLDGTMRNGVMASSYQVDHYVYVSEFHRQQWEELLPELKPLGWATRNGFDQAHVPTEPVKDPNRIIHISRPERGLRPLLAMWPALKALEPNATLAICRYSSMYDQGPGSWSEVCDQYDALVKAVNEKVGGITYLGELGKAELYREIANSAVMWYPGVPDFAETSCIAAIESQACGTPFVGSFKGALPETAAPAFKAGHLIVGNADTDSAYHEASIAAVRSLLEGCRNQTFAYRKLVNDGRMHVRGCSYEFLANQWEGQIERWFRERHMASPASVVRQLLHEDDHVAARLEADVSGMAETVAECDYVIAGKDHGPVQYGEQALADPEMEADKSPRFAAVVGHFRACKATHILDVASGNGSFAIAVLKALPGVKVTGLEWSEANIARSREAVERLGLSDRCTFIQMSVWDFDRQDFTDEWRAFVAETVAHAGTDIGAKFDGLFVGEFIEHVGDCTRLVDGLEAPLAEGASVVYTCPNGSGGELLGRKMPHYRGHVHRFAHDDLQAVFGPKVDFEAGYLSSGVTMHGNPIGNWLIGYTTRAGVLAGPRPLETRIDRTRPRQRLSVGIIAKDAAHDIGRCLESVWPIADEIVVGNCGSTDETRAIVDGFGRRVRSIDLQPVETYEDGFSGARNAVLDACTGEWFLWIDADEVLIGAESLRKYIDGGGPFRGYAIHQNHVSLDMAPHYDKPVRLFRREPTIRFYGCIHEQPQEHTANGDIMPALEIEDVQIVHTGYLHEGIRQAKRKGRNLPMLVRDRERFPERILGRALWVREFGLLGDDAAASAGGLCPEARHFYQQALRLVDENGFDQPTNKYYDIIRPHYEKVVKALGLGYEVEFGMCGRATYGGGLQNRQAKPTRTFVRSASEYRRLIEFRADEIVRGMNPPKTHVDPFIPAPAPPVLEHVQV